MSTLDQKVRGLLAGVLESEKLTAAIGAVIEAVVYRSLRPLLRFPVIDAIVRPDGRPRVAGVFERQSDLIAAIKRLKEAGFIRLVAYSPAPSHELEEAVDAGPSIVRFFTFIGAVLGGTGGFLLAAWSALQWDLIVSGKPIVSVPPYLIIAFECTILGGALATFLGFLISARLPQPELNEVFDQRFSDDRFGLGVVCQEDSLEAAAKALSDAGATEVVRG